MISIFTYLHIVYACNDAVILFPDLFLWSVSQVRNYLPSISAAMGGFTVAQTVWRICIALHAAPRFLITRMYYSYLKCVICEGSMRWARLACFFNTLENLGLVGLTYVSSKENYSEFLYSYISKFLDAFLRVQSPNIFASFAVQFLRILNAFVNRCT